MDALREIQTWYKSQCDGDWEHSWGVTIASLDNPGWSVTIDLTETNLADRPFDEVCQPEDKPDWIKCRVEDAKFVGYCGPLMLENLLGIFLRWAHADGRSN
jgi:hypothetical protein